MFQTNLKIAIRSLLKRKGFTLINSLGLSIGLASCMLIMLYVQYEYSYDTSFEDSDSIYRMVEERTSPSGINIYSNVPYSFVGTILNDYPEVETATSIAGPFPNQRVSILNETGEKINFLESGVLLADSNFFKLFSFQMLQGDRDNALKQPNSIVLSESTAKRFFGDVDPLGKPISIGGRSSLVTGVCEDAPENSHFKFSYIVSSTSVWWFSQEQFNLRYAKCYLKLNPHTNPEALEDKFPEMVDRYLAKEIERVNKVSWEEYQKAGNGYRYFLRPLPSIHLDTDISDGMKPGGNPVMLHVLILVAILIFIIACINFMNLYTARSTERIKEVGVRKVMGSVRHQLIFQFLSEALIISFIGVGLGVLFTSIFIPLFNSLFDASIIFRFSPETLISLLGVAIFISILAGLYPSFMLSNFKTVAALKGKMVFTKRGAWLKNGLVGFQFWISMMLIIGTLVIQKQIHFLNGRDLGFDKDHLLVIEGTFHMDRNFTVPFLEQAKTIPGVKNVAGTLWVQGMQGTWSDEYTVGNSQDIHSLRRVIIGDEVAEVMNFELIEGSSFSEQENDQQFVLLNQSAVVALGIENPVGETIHMISHDEGLLEKTPFTIKGVIRDFNFQSLREEVEPLVIQSSEVSAGRMSYIVAKISGHNIQETVDRLEAKWTETVADRSFTYRFLDDTLAAQYEGERTLATIFSLFSGLSIFISAIGLLALFSYSIVLRTKEIGIRKVIGASIAHLLILLTKDYVKIIAVAFLFAAPVAWYIMNEWLQDFAYRITITEDVFVLAGVSGLLICLIAIMSHAMKAALMNPVESLKEE